jgi:hypothetical protein
VIAPYDLILVGLFVDVAGGVVLASSFMLKSPVEAADEVATRSGQNIPLFRSAIFQRAEAWYGATLLSTGFGLQLMGTYQSAGAANGSGLLHSWPRLMLTAAVTWMLARVPAWSSMSSIFLPSRIPPRPSGITSGPLKKLAVF